VHAGYICALYFLLTHLTTDRLPPLWAYGHVYTVAILRPCLLRLITPLVPFHRPWTAQERRVLVARLLGADNVNHNAPGSRRMGLARQVLSGLNDVCLLLGTGVAAVSGYWLSSRDDWAGRAEIYCVRVL